MSLIRRGRGAGAAIVTLGTRFLSPVSIARLRLAVRALRWWLLPPLPLDRLPVPVLSGPVLCTDCGRPADAGATCRGCHALAGQAHPEHTYRLGGTRIWQGPLLAAARDGVPEWAARMATCSASELAAVVAADIEHVRGLAAAA